MFSIGELARRTGVKVPTIRYYEEVGLLAEAERTHGNQRRYTRDGLERLSFIKHARGLGFSIETINALIDLQNHPDRSCETANAIAREHLADVRAKIQNLRALEQELSLIANSCKGHGTAEHCNVLAALADTVSVRPD